eukprot:TRINITY_DN15101_c0_g1_i1.p1 TRINITY_DN15101_c0_g1~~TRINITY_DN15101_c0_g1_i1.p1  ORF type:complete len:202 (+),score=50.91 TRINITY_DN15101_c0_g1_i1:96-701(+)
MGCLQGKKQKKQSTTTTPAKPSRPTIAEKVKIIIIGDAAVGKTSLVQRFVNNSFGESDVTISDTVVKDLTVDGTSYPLQIWDTGGQEKFAQVTSTYFKFADFVFIVFDINEEGTFNNVNFWEKHIERYCPEHHRYMIIGNKSDLSRNVKDDVAKQYAEQKGVSYLETSAKTGDNVTEMFSIAVRTVLEVRDQVQDIADDED